MEARHPGLGPDAGRAAVYHIDSKQMIRRANHDAYLGIDRAPAVPLGTSWMPELPTVSFHCVRWFFIASWPSVGSFWPIALESFFATGAHAVSGGERGFYRLARNVAGFWSRCLTRMLP